MIQSSEVTGAHKIMLATEILHASVVMLVVACASAIYVWKSNGFPSDLLGFVYGGAITYAGGRAAQSRAALLRYTDTQNGNNHT